MLMPKISFSNLDFIFDNENNQNDFLGFMKLYIIEGGNKFVLVALYSQSVSPSSGYRRK